MKSFNELGLAGPILAALAHERHSTPTPIQSKSIPLILSGRDLIGIAQTGTGKTAAFALPILDRLARSPRPRQPRQCRALILTPTRELANQIEERVVAYGRQFRPTTAIVIGGQPIRPQIRALAPGVDILIATPGRLLDLLGSNAVRLDAVEMLVLDEADRMLDMGFIRPIRDIAARLPRERQNLFFTATMPRAIADLAKTLLSDPATVSVAPESATADRIDQRVLFVDNGRKATVLRDVLTRPDVTRALVFARTKRGADRITKGLAAGDIHAQAIHGNKSQPQRERALSGFRDGRIKVLVATDIAARGIDVPGVSHVINYDLPSEAESYVHRIGRTARAGSEGIAISLCTAEDRAQLKSIEKLIRQIIPIETPDGTVSFLPTTDASRSTWTPVPSNGDRNAASAPKSGRPGKKRQANSGGPAGRSTASRRRRRRSRPSRSDAAAA